MSDIAPTSRLRQIPTPPRWMITFAMAAVAYGVISWLILRAHPEASFRFGFRIEPFLDAGLALKIHVLSALTTFGIGAVLLTSIPKGRVWHKRLGWTWVATMALTATSSFFLVGLNGNHYSWIHGLSAWTIIGLPFAVAAARRKDIKSHSKQMGNMFLGGMAIAGLFTFLPGRMMWSLFFIS